MKNSSYKIGLACGGTGGHVFPGLATAEVLRDRGHKVTLWLVGKDVEQEAVRHWTGPIVNIPAEGFSTLFSFRVLVVAWKLHRAARRCYKIMKEEPPDVLLAMGSYASVGPVRAAMKLKIPIILHEANVIPGRAVVFLSRWATTMAASFEETRYYLKGKDLQVTGMPLRRGLTPSAGHRNASASDRKKELTILVMGGSRSAQKINEVASQALCKVHQQGYPFHVIHLPGIEDEASVKRRYVTHGISHEVFPFAHDMISIYTLTDLAICRSGASTCAEVLAFSVPALFIPYPYATRNHQTLNARALEKRGAVDVVDEKDVGVDWLVEYIADCLQTPKRLAKMSAVSSRISSHNASEALADLVIKAVTTSQ